MLVFHVISEWFHTRMSGIVAYGNKQSGLQLTKIETLVTISDARLTGNTYGLHLKQCNSNTILEAVTCDRNTNSGVFSENSDGVVNATDITVVANNQHGLSFVKTDSCISDILPGVYARQLYIKASELTGNNGNGLHFENSCGMSSTIETTKFDSNALAIYANNGDRKCNMTVENCTFVNQTEATVTLSTAGEVRIIGNQFTNNTGYCISVVSQENLMFIKRNVFTGNVNEPPPYLYVYDLETFSAIVIFQTKAEVTMKYNVFNNPDVQFQMATTVRDISYTFDAAYNYWGSIDVNVVADAIYGYHQQSTMARILYHPYLESADENDFDNTSRKYPDVIRDHDVGGVITYDITLNDTQTPYHVTKDLIVDTNGSINVKEGVVLEFDSGTGIIVTGSIRVIGSSAHEVIMKAKPQNHHPKVRLLDVYEEDQTVSGTIQIYTGAAWRPVHYSYRFEDKRTTLQFLCRAAGFEDYVSMTHVYTENVSHDPLSTITCRSGRFGECEIPDGFMNCSKCDLINVTCQRNYWNGIHLAVDARPSIIQHIRLHQTNHHRNSAPHRAAISVDFLRNHDIHDVKFEDMFGDDSSRALLVSRVGIDSNRVSSLSVDMRSGTAVEFHDSRIHLRHVDVTCSTQRHCSNGIYVESKRGTNLLIQEELIVPFTSLTVTYVTNLMPSFLKLYSGQRYRRHYVRIYTDHGDKIAVELVKMSNPGCVQKTARFHDGLRNESAAVEPTTRADGTAFYSTGSTVDISVEQYYDYCYHTILHVYVYKGNTFRIVLVYIVSVCIHSVTKVIRRLGQ